MKTIDLEALRRAKIHTETYNPTTKGYGCSFTGCGYCTVARELIRLAKHDPSPEVQKMRKANLRLHL